MSELTKRVEKALDTMRPYLETDGGGVKVIKVDKDKNVILKLIGNCGSCPMSAMTLKAGVEEAIKREVPEIQNVYALNVTPPNNQDIKLSSI